MVLAPTGDCGLVAALTPRHGTRFSDQEDSPSVETLPGNWKVVSIHEFKKLAAIARRD